VVIVGIGGQQVPQVVLSEDQKVIQALPADTLDPSFRKRVHVGREGSNRSELNTVVYQDRAELGSELGVPVANNVRRPLLVRHVAEVHPQVPRLLGHPGTVRVWRHAGNVDAPRLDMDEKQHVKRDLPAEGRWATLPRCKSRQKVTIQGK